jgi:hypothetical protein
MINAWREVRDQALRPIYPVPVIEQFLVERAAIMFAERVVERAYVREQIMEAFSE